MYDQSDNNGFHRMLKYLPLVVVVFAAVVGWATLSAENKANTTGVHNNKEAITDARRELNEVKETVIRIEEAQKWADKNAKEMAGDIKDILREIRNRRD